MTSDNTTEDDRGFLFYAWRVVLCVAAAPIALIGCWGLWRLALLLAKP